MQFQSSVWRTVMKLGTWVVVGRSTTHVVCRHQMHIFDTSFAYLFWLANNKKMRVVYGLQWQNLVCGSGEGHSIYQSDIQVPPSTSDIEVFRCINYCFGSQLSPKMPLSAFVFLKSFTRQAFIFKNKNLWKFVGNAAFMGFNATKFRLLNQNSTF